MWTALRVNAAIIQPQPFNRPAADQVFSNDLRRISGLHMAVPDSLGVDHHRRAMFALVQAPCLVDAHLSANPGGFYKLLQLRQQVALAVLGARGPRSTLGANILTDKDMAFKRGQMENPPIPMIPGRLQPSFHRLGCTRNNLPGPTPLPSATIESDLWKLMTL
jgi:hypothetical protein